jgi:sugar O-acyltransferase (sialic acid O-acetyltransferase NeuD family)
MSIQRLILLGTSGNAHDILEIVSAINAQFKRWEIVGFLDDRASCGASFLGFQVLGALASAPAFADCQFINCIGSDRSYRMRPALIASTGLPNSRFATLVHPQANVSARAQLGCGVYVSFAASIGGDTFLGDHVSVSPSVVVGHDSCIGDFVTLAPGAVISGCVKVGSSAYLGARSVVRQCQTIGPLALIGMGAVVTHDVLPAATVVGVPARQITPVVGNGLKKSQVKGTYTFCGMESEMRICHPLPYE